MGVGAKILVGMSGGVDSSVAAVLLKLRGCDVAGAILRMSGPEHGEREAGLAREVASRYGFPLYEIDAAELFEKEVIDRFCSAYLEGLTPNPCIVCNRDVKFRLLIEQADALGMDMVATGHYARVEQAGPGGRHLLKKAADAAKDQSYMLCMLTQEQLRRAVFPLGGLTKRQVRGLAEKFGLAAASERESQDICFVPDGDYASLIERRCGGPGEGLFVDRDGKRLGAHRGHIHYTVGQRRGISLSFPRRMYVVSKCAADNTVTLGPEEELYASCLTADGVNLISVDKIDAPMRMSFRTRYSHGEAPGVIWPNADGTLCIQFDAPQRAVTPGQTVAFYDGDTVVGGGRILRVGR